ncbi:MAG: helix-turn-helix domain-containing protein [Candidatus Bathyarchaeota archaeon]|nr:helix-turn-helix domain-containing protein [Candidatus Bathyarchaeota archaeon]
MGGTEALRDAEAALHQAGFQVSRRCISRASCFDFAARDEERLVFAKVLRDIREVSRGVAAAMKSLASCFSCVSVFISDRSGEDSLRDDTVYSRYGVNVVTLKTFSDIVSRGHLPLVKASRGGYSVAMDGGKIRERRHELGLSIGKLAGMVGISRRTLYGYEREMTRASVSSAYQLEKILGATLVRTLDIFGPPSTSSSAGSSLLGDCVGVRNRLLQSILGKLTQFGLEVLPMSKAPFDFAAECPREGLRIVGGLFRRKERLLKDRVKEVLSVSRIIGVSPLLLGEGSSTVSRDVAFLSCDDLARMRDRGELTALL